MMFVGVFKLLLIWVVIIFIFELSWLKMVVYLFDCFLNVGFIKRFLLFIELGR